MPTKPITICNYELSQYHAGQTITPTAKIWCDGQEWHSLVSWYDRSDQTTKTNKATHSTQAEAERAITQEVVVQSDSWSAVDLYLLARLKKIASKYEMQFRLAFTSDGRCLLNGVLINPTAVCSEIVRKFDETKHKKIQDAVAKVMR